MRSPTRFDCVIVGGGPAGSTLAWLLAESEFRVLLIDTGSRPGGAPRETLLAAAGGAIERAGLSQLLSAGVDTRRHGAIWGSDQLLWREPSGGGLLLERSTFDAELRAAAQRRGVEIRTRSRVLGPLPTSGAGELEVLTEDGQIERVTTDRIVLATGKRAPRDLITLQDVARGPETAALCLGAECPEAAHLAIVEAVASGWWWWIGDGESGGTATLLCDVEELTGTGTRGLVECARREAHGPVREIRNAVLSFATRSTARCVQTESPVLLLGDAAATLDPLSSQGVEKALLAADQAAAALRAAKMHPAWWPRLCIAHHFWEHGLYEAHRATTASFLVREQRFTDRPFWRLRASMPDTQVPSPAPNERWVQAPEILEHPVLERFGSTFHEVDGAMHRTNQQTIVTVGHVPVIPILRAFQQPITLTQGIERAGRDPRLFVLAPRDVRDAAIELHQRGWLNAAEST